MNRTISVERLYTIADYQNIKFTSSISDIPDDLVLDDDAIQLLYYSQSLECDIAYKKYMQLRETIAREKVTNVLEFLNKEEVTAKEQIIEQLKQTTGD